VLDSDIGTAMTIESISWMYVNLDPNAVCEGFTLHLGYCADDVLDLDFDANWVPGSKTLVYSADPLDITAAGPETWVTLDLDEPFWYNGVDNLLIDVQWNNSGSDNSFYAAHWVAGDDRALFEYNTPSYVHTTAPFVPYMTLLGELDLQQDTFAGIKVLLGD